MWFVEVLPEISIPMKDIAPAYSAGRALCKWVTQERLRKVPSATANGEMPHSVVRCLAYEERGSSTLGMADK